MIWREAYETRVLEGGESPPVLGASLSGDDLRLHGPYVVVAGFELRSLTEREVWRRLIASAFGTPEWFVDGVVAHGWNAQTLEHFRMVTPKALHRTTFALVDPAWEWHRLVQPDRANRSFAAVIAQGQARLLMVGPPTEEAWERFEREIRDVVLAGESDAAPVA